MMTEEKKKSDKKTIKCDFLKGVAVNVAVLAAMVVITTGLMGCDDGSREFVYRGNLDAIIQISNVSSTVSVPSGMTITSPYYGVNWDTFGQYKAALHTHSSRSDGANTLAQMIEEKYRQDFDIVAMTDHNITNNSWTTGLGRLDEARYQAMAIGTAPRRNHDGTLEAAARGRGLLRLSNTNEQSRNEHINSFWAPWNNAPGITLAEKILGVQDADGISFINHIGRYSHKNAADPEVRIAVSNDPVQINKYADLFLDFPSLVGMEIINRRDMETYSDRILWDNILKITAPQGRNVWGFSTDDSHSHTPSENGNSYSMLLMSELTEAQARIAMEHGRHYAVARVSRLELGERFYGDARFPPIIKSIVVSGSNITITTENINVIEWISDGVVIGRTTASTSTFDASGIGSYVRANLMGPGGIAFTQPFIVNR
jgi:hypothetical protein